MGLALEVTDIDDWLVKVDAAGCEVHTDFVWQIPGVPRSFIFFDADGNQIQLVEELMAVATAP